MQLTYYGHSCFAVEINGQHLLFDPFITGNPLATHIDINTIKADYILLSHAHQDHELDTMAIAERTNATIICAWEIMTYYNILNSYSNFHPMNTGGTRPFGSFTVKCTVAQHSSSFSDGGYGGNPMGFLITTDTQNFYYSGDTALTMDMKLIPMWAPKLDFAILPIGDNFTMGAADAAIAAEWVGTKKVVGVHYDTFGYIAIDKEVAKNTFKQKGIELLLPEIGSLIAHSL